MEVREGWFDYSKEETRVAMHVNISTIVVSLTLYVRFVSMGILYYSFQKLSAVEGMVSNSFNSIFWGLVMGVRSEKSILDRARIKSNLRHSRGKWVGRITVAGGKYG